MAAISAFGVTQHSQIFSLFFRNRIQCIALYQLHNSQALLATIVAGYAVIMEIQKMAKTLKDKFPPLGSYHNKSTPPPPGQNLGFKSPRVGANFGANSQGCVGGWLWMKLTPVLWHQYHRILYNTVLYCICSIHATAVFYHKADKFCHTVK